jgi:hypothetical protein
MFCLLPQAYPPVGYARTYWISMMKKLFIAMAIIEMMTGLVLIVSPAMLAWLLLGSLLDVPQAIIIARLGGVALLSLGTVCWFASRDENSPAAAGVMAAMVLYNCGVIILLAYAGIGLGLSGVGLWPAVLVHTILAVGSIASVKSRATSTQTK